MFSIQAQAVQVTGEYLNLASEFEYLVDPGGNLSLEQILEHPQHFKFTASSLSKPPIGFNAVWLKLELEYPYELSDNSYYLSTLVTNFLELDIYRPISGGWEHWRTGNNYPADSREVESKKYAFHLNGDDGAYTIYLRFVGGPGTEKLPWILMDRERFENGAVIYNRYSLVCVTVMLTLCVFNLGLAGSLRRRDFLWYSVYVLSATLGMATMDGSGFYYLWPDMPSFNTRFQHGFNLLTAIARLLAICFLLGIPRLAPKLFVASQRVAGSLFLMMGLVLILGVDELPPLIASWVWVVGIAMGFVVCGYAVQQRVRLALPLLVVLLLPFFTAALQGYLMVGTHNISMVGLQLAKIGFAAQCMLFSLCLAMQIKVETESRIRALHDSLTGLPGTDLLREHFEVAVNICRRHDWKVAVFFLDLDGFKAVNDQLGHAVGDALLVQVAERIQGNLRKSDTVARIGGDEFVVLLTEVKADQVAHTVAEKIVTAVAAPYDIEGKNVEVSVSVGISMFPDQGEDLRALLEVADSAMYDVKKSGKNAYAVANSSLVSHGGASAKLRLAGS